VALTRTLAQLREGTRKFANVQGTTALQRHPDADVNDYVNRALGSLHRKLTEAHPDQRYLGTTSFTTSSGTTAYSLPADFESLLLVELTYSGVKIWLVAYEPHEHAALTDPSASFTGIPFCYRLRGANIDLLPTPGDSYTCSLWYLPTSSTLSSDASTYDTINRLDDYVYAYAGRLIAIKEKNWDLVSAAKGIIDEMTGEILALGRNRDRNAPARIVDETHADRWGRRLPYGRRGYR
jgi:hypothetical protein